MVVAAAAAAEIAAEAMAFGVVAAVAVVHCLRWMNGSRRRWGPKLIPRLKAWRDWMEHSTMMERQPRLK